MEQSARGGVTIKGAPFWKNPHFWYITAAMAVCSILYYLPSIVNAVTQQNISPGVFGAVHDLHRMIFLLPAGYATYIFREKGAAISVAVMLLVLLPRVLLLSPFPDPLLRLLVFAVVAGTFFVLLAIYLNDVEARKELTEKYRTTFENTGYSNIEWYNLGGGGGDL